MRAVRTYVAITAIATASTLLITAPASAEARGGRHSPDLTILTTAVAAPFNLEVDGSRVLVADGGPGVVARILRDGTLRTVVADAPGAAGVATSGRYLAYTTTEGGPPVGPITASGVTIIGPAGRTTEVDTLAYEQEHNPDQANRYGLVDPAACMVQEPRDPQVPPPSYTGIVDSHAYSLTAYRGGFVLADAGANALLWIGRDGSVRTLAVLPPQPATVTPQVAAMFGLSCSGDVVYNFEPVPTDVEVGPDGYLYVTTLPGGPEDPSLGARGKVYRVNPRTGASEEFATGLLGPTNLAFAKGRLYVTEFFAGRVSRVRGGTVVSSFELPNAVAVEAGPQGDLYVGAGVFGPGSVVRVNGHGKGWRR